MHSVFSCGVPRFQGIICRFLHLLICYAFRIKHQGVWRAQLIQKKNTKTGLPTKCATGTWNDIFPIIGHWWKEHVCVCFSRTYKTKIHHLQWSTMLLKQSKVTFVGIFSLLFSFNNLYFNCKVFTLTYFGAGLLHASVCLEVIRGGVCARACVGTARQSWLLSISLIIRLDVRTLQ